MDHLTTETLARIVDETPSPAEAEHLAECHRCIAALATLRRQTEALASLPELMPPMGDWDVLEARLRSEGLVRDPGLLERLGRSRTPGWMRAAAAVVLFLGGTALGAFLDGDTPVLPGSPTPAGFVQAASVEDAAGAVRVAEQNYITALTRYRQLLSEEGGDVDVSDPASRFAALEYLVAASQAAVRQAPADPFLNGLLASTLAEREATLRTISSSQDTWF